MLEWNTNWTLNPDCESEDGTQPDEIEEISAKDIAIIGMSVNFPLADSLETFWERLSSGTDCIRAFPEARKRDADAYARSMNMDAAKTAYTEMGYLDEIDTFDYSFFKLSPREACLMDPNQRMFLQCAWKAIEDAGYGGNKLVGSSTGVYVGFSGTAIYDYKRLIHDVEPSAATVATTGNVVPVIASRISYLLDLHGPSLVIDTACSSSLVAVNLATRAIRNGDCDMALAGGVRINLMPLKKTDNIGMDASDCRTKTFDHSADGAGWGEGVAAILLKPLSQAQRDGDHVYAVVKGSAVNQDGSSAGITAPNSLAQAQVLEKSWKDAGIAPETISYIEAHGSGTALGDPIEIDGIQKAFGKYTDRRQFCAIGSVKTNIGHLDSVAGMAGLVKSVLALKHKQLPPTVHFMKPNRKIKFHKSPVYVNRTLRNWESDGTPLRCGVSAFGLSGTNCHVILEEAPERRSSQTEHSGPQLFVLSAKSKSSLHQLVLDYGKWLQTRPDISLEDICFTASTGRGHYSHRLAMVVADRKHLAEQIEQMKDGRFEELAGQGIYYGDQQAGGKPAQTRVLEQTEDGTGDKSRSVEQLNEWGRLYANGTDMDWDLLYSGIRRNRVSLPTYPFDRTRCWFETGQSGEEQTGDLYRTLKWVPEPLAEPSTANEHGGCILLIKDDGERGNQLANLLRRGPGTVIEVEIEPEGGFRNLAANRYSIGESEDCYFRLIQALKGNGITKIVHLATCSGEGEREASSDNAEELQRMKQRGIYSLHHLVKALTANKVKRAVELVLVSEYVHEVTGREERLLPYNALLFGLGKVVPLEYANLACRCIDMDRETSTEALIAELYSPGNRYQVAYRHGVRHAEEFGKMDLPKAASGITVIHRGGTYVITGGLGGIGLEIGKYLSSRNEINLVLINRSPFPDRSLWQTLLANGEDDKLCKKIAAIREIEATGSVVTCYSADVGDFQKLASVFGDIRAKFGRINGIVHGAGLVDGAVLIRKDKKSMERVIRPKVDGTVHLHHLTERDALDFFVLFSSNTTLLGEAGLGDYTAANAYLDSFTAYRNRLGKRTLTINWAGWQETGMVVDFGLKHGGAYKFMSTKAAIRAFDELLCRDIARVIVGELDYSNAMFDYSEQFPFRLSGQMTAELKRRKQQEKHAVSGTRTDSVVLSGRADGVYSEMEQAVADIWGDVLGYKEMQLSDNFYELGGDSILIIKTIAKIAEKLCMDVSVLEFVERNTIESLAGLLEGRQPYHRAPLSPLYPAVVPDWEQLSEPFPLTDVQAAYLFGRSSQFELGGVSTHAYTELSVNLDMERFNRCLNAVIHRHPMLRAVVLPNGMQQILRDVPDYDIPVKDLRHLDGDSQQRTIMQVRETMSHHQFQTDQWPLFQFRAFRLSEEKHYLFIGFDILIADGASADIIIAELMRMYRGGEDELSPIRLSFRDYMLAYKQFKLSDAYHSGKKYWLQKLEDFPSAPSLPLRGNPMDVKHPRFNRLSERLGTAEWEKLKAKAQQHRLSTSALLCTVYAELLAFWSNQPRLAVNMTVFNRYPFHEDIDKLVGDFTSIILIGLDFEAHRSFWERASHVQKTVLEGLEHRHYDGIEFMRDIARARRLGTKAVMPVVFTSMLFNNAQVNAYEELDVTMRITQTPQVFLDQQVAENDGELEINWDYVEELFEPAIIEVMFRQYIERLRQLAENDEIGWIQVPPDSLRLIEAYNDTAEDIVPAALHELFARQAKRSPANTAVIDGNTRITYAQLDEASNRVARYLQAQGVQANELVGIVAHRTIDTIVGVLGILKAGAAYVPIDPEYPEERKVHIVKHSNCRLTVEADAAFMNRAAAYPPEDMEETYFSERPAYVIYTSGSTGNPKGVVITHRAVANTILDMNREFSVTEQDRFMAVSSMCFDLSVYDLFGALSAGASVVLVPDQRDVRSLLQTVEKHHVTIWNSVPAIMSMLIDYTVPSPNNTALRLVLLSGDWIPLQLPGKIAEAFPAAATISLGGATEVSIWSIYHPIDAVNTGWKSIPYGKPLSNQTVYVLDFAGELCPPGVQGELYIGGAGLAEGYLFDEEKTSQSFIDHNNLGRLYRTGDFGILHREGWIEFLGRKDHQVKIRGYRVELGEIESCLARHELIRHAVVVDHREENGHKSLCAYVVSDEQLAVSELREYAAKLLPDYMIPSYFVQMDDIPLTPNGKLDRSALPKPQDHLHLGVLYEAPGNETEERLVTLWQQLLDTPKVGIHDNFFELGGNSLLLVELHARLEEEFPGKLALTDLFAYPSVARLAERIKAGKPDLSTKLEGVVFPADYVADSVSFEHTASFRFRIGSESYGRLREIARHHKAEISDLLLFIYSYVIADATGQSQVAVHTMLHERGRVNAYSIDETSMEDIGCFAESLQRQRDSRDGEYRIAEAGRTRQRDAAGSRAMFIYRKELYAGQSDLTSVYDLVLEMDEDEDEDEIQFVCEFQASRLKEESVERLMNHYVRMIDFVGNEYSAAQVGS